MDQSSKNAALENVYTSHHRQRRGNFFVIEEEKRGGFLKDKIGQNKVVLDIGIRDGALASNYLPGNDVLGVDIDREALKRAVERYQIKTEQIDLNGDWGLPAEHFDAVVAAEVLEHVYYPDIIIQKVKAVLKSDGIFVGSIPHAFSLQSRVRILFGTKKSTPLQDPTHINHFSYREFKTLLGKHFKEVEIKAIVSKKFSWLTPVFPYLFAYGLLFYAKGKK